MEDERSQGQHQMLSIDEIIETYADGFGRSQLFHTLLLVMATGFDAVNTFLPIFTDAQPSWRCISNVTSLSPTQNCTSKSSICDLDPNEWEWEAGKEASIISEWNLICHNSFKAGIPPSLFFIGALFGCMTLGPLADSWLGRKRMLIVSSLTLSVTGLLTAFSPNLWVYALLRALNGFGRAPIITCSLVLSTELVGRKWRGVASFLVFLSCTIGFLSLPAFAYYTRYHFSWRRTYIYISILPMAYTLLLLPFVWESPRWLQLQGKANKALQILRKMAELNGRTLPTNVGVEDCCREGQQGSVLSSLWRSRWARKRLMMTMAVGFGMGLIYFGMPLGVGNLDFNIYLSTTFNAVSEIPATFLSTFLVGKARRRRVILLLTLMSGVFCFMCALYSMHQGPAIHANLSEDSRKNWWEMVGELGAFVSCVTAFNVLLVYSMELFPTSVRNSAVSMLRQAINVGAILSPMVVVIGHRAQSVSFLVFGMGIIVSGLFVLGLPETMDQPLYETLEDQEYHETEWKTSLGVTLLS